MNLIDCRSLEQPVYTLEDSSSFHGFGPFMLNLAKSDFKKHIDTIEALIKATREKKPTPKVIQQLNELGRREHTIKPIQSMVKRVETFNEYDHDQKE